MKTVTVHNGTALCRYNAASDQVIVLAIRYQREIAG